MSVNYPWAPGYPGFRPNTSRQIARDTETTYLNWKKTQEFDNVGWFLVPYVVDGGYVTKNIKRNDQIDISATEFVLDNSLQHRDSEEGLKLKSANATYFVDIYKGDYWVDTAHPSGTAGTDYITLATVTTDVNGNVDTITDTTGIRGGFRLKSDYGLFGYPRPVYNLVDYGAKGDGITNDSEAAQKAIDAAAKKGGIVKGAPGDIYFIPTTLIVPDGVVFEDCYFKAKMSPGGTGWYPNRILQNEDMVDGNENIAIRNCTFDGAWTGQGYDPDSQPLSLINPLVRLEKVNNLQLDNVLFTNYSSNYSYLELNSHSPLNVRNCEHVRINNLRLINSRWGVMFYRNTDVIIREYYAANENCSTPLDSYYNTNFHVLNPIIFEDLDGTHSGSTINFCNKQASIIGGRIEGGRGVDVGNEAAANGNVEPPETDPDFVCDIVEIIGLQIQRGGIYASGGEIISDIRNLTIAHCVIEPETSEQPYGIRVGNLINGKFLYNTIRNNANIRIFQESVNGLIIEGNTLDGRIFITLSEGKAVRNLVIRGNKITAPLLGSNTLTDVLTRGASCGVYVANTADALGTEELENVVIEDNDIFAEGAWILMSYDASGGNRIYTDGLIIRGNRLYSSENGCIRGILADTGKDLLIEDNRVKDPQTNYSRAIRFENVAIKNNRVLFDLTTQGDAPWLIDQCSGKFEMVDNYCDSNASSHIRYQSTNTFSDFNVQRNEPDTFTGTGTPRRRNTGTTSNRPSGVERIVGVPYYDETLGKMIVWSGSAWVNMDGTSL